MQIFLKKMMLFFNEVAAIGDVFSKLIKQKYDK